MSKSIDYKALMPYALVLLGFLLISAAFYSPLLKGEVLKQDDIIRWEAMSKEARDYYEEQGEPLLWTQSQFGGMPTYLIALKGQGNSFKPITRFVSLEWLVPRPIGVMWLGMACFFLLMISFKIDPWVGAIGGIAYGMMTYGIISLIAGHTGKVHAIAFMPMLLAGAKWIFDRKFWLGSAVFLLGLAMQLTVNHPQITYYTFLIIAIWGIAEIIHSVRNKVPKLGQYYLKVFGLLALGAAFAVLSTSTRLFTAAEYSTQSIRGPSELIETKKQYEARRLTGDTMEYPANPPAKAKGLDKGYIYEYSYGIFETFSWMFPNAVGGSNISNFLNDGSSKSLNAYRGVFQRDKKKANQLQNLSSHYWGDLPFTSGPIYFGALVMLLFFVALAYLKGRMKWWLLAAVILGTFLGLGKHFALFNNLMVDHFPAYDKFRTVMMAMTIPEVLVLLLGLVGLGAFLKPNQKGDEERKWKALKTGGIAFGGICLLLLVLPGAFTDFTGASGRNLLKETNDPDVVAMIDAARADRKAILQSTVIRTLIFGLISAALLWASLKGKLKRPLVIGLLASVALTDMWLVGSSYLNKENPNNGNKVHFADENYIQQSIVQGLGGLTSISDPDPHYRVINFNYGNPTQDGATPYYFSSISGYHGAKIRRVQETFNWLYTNRKGRDNLLNMLNTKYFIGKKPDGTMGFQENDKACGNAWFVEEIKFLENSDKEIRALRRINPKKTATVIEKYKSALEGFQTSTDSNSKIELVEYNPQRLVYKSTSSKAGFALFSEVFYRGNKDWISYLNGQQVDHIRANYILRGLVIPAGENEIVFEFKPPTYFKMRKVAKASSLLGILLVLGLFYLHMREENILGLGQKKKV